MDAEGRNAVVAETYDKLRRIARQHLRRIRPGETLNTNAVVHEAYIKLSRDPGAWWDDREEFLKVAATAMRHLILDYARAKRTDKRGSGAVRVTLSDGVPAPESDADVLDVFAVDEALKKISLFDPELERIVEFRFFAGMTMAETAGALGRPIRSVERDWARARTYLLDLLRN